MEKSNDEARRCVDVLADKDELRRLLSAVISGKDVCYWNGYVAVERARRVAAVTLVHCMVIEE